MGGGKAGDVLAVLADPRRYCQGLLTIRNKEGKQQKLTFNDAQENLYAVIQQKKAAGEPVRLIVLKGRQEGISTLVEGLMFQGSATLPNVKTLVVAHETQSTANLFKMNKLFYDCLPSWAQPMKKASNAKELVFENPTKDEAEKRRRPGLRSSIRCQTAGKGGVGRSDTLTYVHLSEYAFWPDNKEDLLLGIMQAVPDKPGTMVVIESTARGYDHFKTLWDGATTGTNGWTPVFLPWYMEPGYRRPVTGQETWTAQEMALQREYGLDEEQLVWRRWCISVNCGGNEALFRQEYPCNPDEAFLLSGDGYFDNEALGRLRQKVPEPMRSGAFQWQDTAGEYGAPLRWAFTDNRSGGLIRVWREPEKGVPYVIGGDTAGEGSDLFTAFVIDNRTGEQVAELQQQASELLYARQVYCLGLWYNAALLGIEVNFSTYPVAKLEEWGYPSLYQRERADTYTGAMVKAFGWQTSGKTRPLALATLHTVMEETPELVRSRRLMGEMLTFVYDAARRPAAAPGQHDDLVMAAAICYAIRHQQETAVEAAPEDRSWWTKDMQEDYRRADKTTREILAREWQRQPSGGK